MPLRALLPCFKVACRISFLADFLTLTVLSVIVILAAGFVGVVGVFGFVGVFVLVGLLIV